MNNDFDKDRREFIRSLGRKLALGSMLLGTGVLVAKPGARNETCISDGICSRCRILPNCGLPQALSERRAMSDER